MKPITSNGQGKYLPESLVGALTKHLSCASCGSRAGSVVRKKWVPASEELKDSLSSDSNCDDDGAR